MVHETVDGEVIVIDLATGAYYSLPGTASEIWQSIAVGSSREAIVAHVAGRYEQDTETVNADIDDFLTHLLDEELVVEDATGIAGAAPVEEANNRPATPFAKPVLEKYTDMAELILLDPVHDVSALGWPDEPDGRS